MGGRGQVQKKCQGTPRKERAGERVRHTGAKAQSSLSHSAS